MRIKEREEAIQQITMDPKVYGKLLTHHQRSSKDDEEPLRDRFPSDRVPEKASRRYLMVLELVVAEKVFHGLLCWFHNFREFIEAELGQMEPHGSHNTPRRAYPWVCPGGL